MLHLCVAGHRPPYASGRGVRQHRRLACGAAWRKAVPEAGGARIIPLPAAGTAGL